MKFHTLAINPWFLIRNTLLLLATLLIAFFLQSTILVSPSHPFVDGDGDGIDDFEEGIGEYADPEVRARIYGVNFPITDLGNCGGYSECRNFCEDPVNSTICIDFAKAKGFYQEDKVEVGDSDLAVAKRQLGCDSYASCLNYCEVPANFDKCDSFAKGQGLVGGHVEDPSKTQVLTKAKEFLGCDSATGCQSYCSKEENRQKCSEFAKTVGLHGGERQVGPGGCTSEATCKAFCSDPNNFQICSGFSSTSGGTFTGPGGCNSEASCKTYCQQHEDECRSSFGGPGAPGYNPQEMCNRTPNCSWAGNTCQCGFYGETEESQHKAGEYAAFCQANPDKCKPGQPSSFDNPEQRQQFEDYCTKNPDKCKPTSGGPTGPAPYPGSDDPAAACARYGCTWSNNSCQCTGSGGTQPGYSPYPQPTSGSYTSPSGGSYDPATECVKQSGCSWTGSNCQCSTTSGSSGTTTSGTPPPSTSEPAPQPTSSTSQPTGEMSSPAPQSSPTVQGVSVVRSLLQNILDWISQ